MSLYGAIPSPHLLLNARNIVCCEAPEMLRGLQNFPSASGRAYNIPLLPQNYKLFIMYISSCMLTVNILHTVCHLSIEILLAAHNVNVCNDLPPLVHLFVFHSLYLCTTSVASLRCLYCLPHTEQLTYTQTVCCLYNVYTSAFLTKPILFRHISHPTPPRLLH